jgi:hypothetical protein
MGLSVVLPSTILPMFTDDLLKLLIASKDIFIAFEVAVTHVVDKEINNDTVYAAFTILGNEVLHSHF